MISHFTKPFFQALNLIFKDKVNLIYTLLPLSLAIVIYGFGISYAYGLFKEWLHVYLRSTIDSETIGFMAYYALIAFLTVLCFFLINWTFVLITSIIASPFNTLISERIAKTLNLKPAPTASDRNFLARSLWIVILETKKVLLIALLSFVTIVVGYIPLLTPIALILTFLLISIQFVDYSWSRVDLKIKDCFKDTIGHLFFYIPAGGLFFLLINIPLVSLFVPAIATAYFTIYWENR